MTVEAFQKDRFSVQENLPLFRLDLPYAERFDDMVVFRSDFKRMQIRRFRGPEFEVRHSQFKRSGMSLYRERF